MPRHTAVRLGRMSWSSSHNPFHALPQLCRQRLQSVFVEALKQARRLLLAHTVGRELTGPLHSCPRAVIRFADAERREIAGDRKRRLNDRVAIASSDLVERFEALDNRDAVRALDASYSTALSELALRNGGQPVRQRGESTNQPPHPVG